MIYLEVVLWCLFLAWWLYRLVLIIQAHRAGAYDPRGVFYYLITLVVLVTYGRNIFTRLLQVI